MTTVSNTVCYMDLTSAQDLSPRFWDGFVGDAIKWPELNNDRVEAEMRPLPNRSLGGKSDFDDSSSQVNLTGYGNAPPAAPYYDTQSVHTSTVDLHHGSGPVEPSQQQYYEQGYGPNHPDGGNRDSGFYDPYAGPVPQAFSPHGPAYGQGGSPDQSGRVSPGPNMAYGGRTPSPGPNIAYGGRVSPGPNAAYGGRVSPGPGPAYGRSTSPGPNAAYGGGRVGSPGPGAFNPRSTSPGPNAAFGGAGYAQRAGCPGPNAAYRTG